jgi:hypothetical protein
LAAGQPPWEAQTVPMIAHAQADRVWHGYAPGADDVRLVTASFLAHRFVPHAHSEYAIAVISRGVETVRYRGADERAGAGDLLLLDAEVIHAGRPAVPRGASCASDSELSRTILSSSDLSC